MIVFYSKLLGEKVVIAESKKDFDAAAEKADELGCALYTDRELQWLIKDMSNPPTDGDRAMVKSANDIKKKFKGWLTGIPKDFRPEPMVWDRK